jgi:hypothetical protein
MLPPRFFRFPCTAPPIFASQTPAYSTQRKTKHNATQHPMLSPSRLEDPDVRHLEDGMEMEMERVWWVVGAEMASVQTDRQTDRQTQELGNGDAENLIIIGRLGLAANILTLACRNIRHGIAVHP